MNEGNFVMAKNVLFVGSHADDLEIWGSLKYNEGVFFDKSKNRWFVRERKGGFLWSHVVYQNFVLNGQNIPVGYVIHHRNGDETNDDVDNLEMLLHGEHTSLHSKRREITQETKDKISETLTGRKLSEEHCLNISKALKNKPVNPNSLKNINRSGMKASEQTRKKQSESLKKAWEDKELREKWTRSHEGYVTSEETKEKLSQALKRRVFTEEWKERISEGLTGKLKSQETKDKISETLKRRAREKKDNNK